jgi:hypothetical protein
VIDPRLGPLANNGGPTHTHALLPGSPALDAGAVITGPPQGYDQRGNPFSRMVDGTGDGVVRIDIGAYESQGVPHFSPGDYNRDGLVDACDFTIWRNTLGELPVTPFSGADGNGDGFVNEADFDVWKSHFGQGLRFTFGGSGAIAALAEPEAPVLTALPLPLAGHSAVHAGAVGRDARSAPAAAASHDDALIAWLAAQSRDEPDGDSDFDSHAVNDDRTDTDSPVEAIDTLFATLDG